MSISTDSKIDCIHDLVDAIMREECWKSLDVVLERCNINDLDLVLTLLTATLPGKSKLMYRETFLERAKTQYNKDLFNGL